MRDMFVGSEMRRGISTAIFAVALFAAAPPALSDISSDVAKGLEWRQLGPFRGGWATMVAGVPGQPDVFYFARSRRRRLAHGRCRADLVAAFSDTARRSVGALAIAPSNPKVIYVGTGQPEPRYDIARGHGRIQIDGRRSALDVAGASADTRYIGAIWIESHRSECRARGRAGTFLRSQPARGTFPLHRRRQDLVARAEDQQLDWRRRHRERSEEFANCFSPPPGKRINIRGRATSRRSSGAGSAIYKSIDGGVTLDEACRAEDGRRDRSAASGLQPPHLRDGTRVYAEYRFQNCRRTLPLRRRRHALGARQQGRRPSRDWYASRLTVAPERSGRRVYRRTIIRRCTDGGKTCDIFKGAPGGDDYHHVWINPLHPDHMITGSDQGAVVSVEWRADLERAGTTSRPGSSITSPPTTAFPTGFIRASRIPARWRSRAAATTAQSPTRDWHPVGGDERDYDIPDPADPDDRL